MLNSILTILFSWQYLEFSFTCIFVHCIVFWNLTWIGQICAEKLSQLPIQYWSVITTESIWIEGVSLYHIFKLNFIGLWSGLSFAVRQGDFAGITYTVFLETSSCLLINSISWGEIWFLILEASSIQLLNPISWGELMTYSWISDFWVDS